MLGRCITTETTTERKASLCFLCLAIFGKVIMLENFLASPIALPDHCKNWTHQRSCFINTVILFFCTFSHFLLKQLLPSQMNTSTLEELHQHVLATLTKGKKMISQSFPQSLQPVPFLCFLPSRAPFLFDFPVTLFFLLIFLPFYLFSERTSDFQSLFLDSSYDSMWLFSTYTWLQVSRLFSFSGTICLYSRQVYLSWF